MQISYFGHSSFRIKSGSSVLLTDPFNPKYIGLAFPKTSADIITISHNHQGHNDLTRLNKPAFVIDSPGEYEIKGFSIIGLPSYHDKDKTIPNNIYIIEAEGIKVCHLGDLGHLLEDKQLDEIDGIDVLLIRVGSLSKSQISLQDTIKLINQIEPSFIVPIHYRTKEMTNPHWLAYPTLDEFLKEYGSEGEKLDKLVITKASLPEETKLVILK